MLIVDSTGYEQLGGAAGVVNELLDRVDRDRWTPVLVCLTEGGWPAQVRARGIPAYTLVRRRLRSVGNLLSVVYRLRRLIRRHRAVLLHASENSALVYASLAGWLTRTPVVWHIHSPFLPRSGAERAAARLLRWLAPAHIVFTSPAARQKSVALPAAEHSVVYPGVDVARLRSGDPVRGRRRLGVPDRARLVSMFARMDPAKGQRAFIETLAGLRRDRPDVYGAACGLGWPGGPYWTKLEGWRDEHGLDGFLVMPGHLTPAERDDVVAASDVVLHPSVAESFGLAVLEAMAAGKPVVAMAADGPRLLVDDGVDGVLVPINDVAAMTAAAARFLDDPAWAAAVGARAAASAERYDIAETTRRIEAVWAAVVSAPRGRRPVAGAPPR